MVGRKAEATRELLTACEDELVEPITALLPRAYGPRDAPQLRLALTTAELRAIFYGARLLEQPLETLLAGSALIVAERRLLPRWQRPFAHGYEMVVVRIHVPSAQLTVAERQAARFGLRTETFLVACTLELLREHLRHDPGRWAVAAVPQALSPAWREQDGSTLQFA